MNTRLGFPPTAITEAGEYCLDLQYMQELTLANLEDEARFGSYYLTF